MCHYEFWFMLLAASLGTGLQQQTPDLGSPIVRSNLSLSTPEQCARACRDGEPPKNCYYNFTIEHYNVLGAACQECTEGSECQCVQADGVDREAILTVNRMLPGPSIQVCQNDTVIIDVQNAMEDMKVSIHWHGIRQRGSQYYDGVPFVTQCPIQQGDTFRYQWTAANTGTHFWHAHALWQQLDGLYGSIVVREAPSQNLNSHLYDFDLTTHVMFVSDWLHECGLEMDAGRLTVKFREDSDNVLINGKGQFMNPNTSVVTNTPLETFRISRGKRYRFRLINSFGTACPALISVERHALTIIATDGEPVQPVNVNTIISFSGERYDFVITADQPVGAYWIQVRSLGKCGEKKVMQLAVLRYSRGPDQPSTQKPTYDVGLPQGVVLNPLDAVCNRQRTDAVCINQLKNAKHIDEGLLQERADVRIVWSIRFLSFKFGEYFKPYSNIPFMATIPGDTDEITSTFPHSPLLSQIDDIPPEQFCENTRPNCASCMCIPKVDIRLNAIVDVALLDDIRLPNFSYPFHLHGHSFHVISVGRIPDRNYNMYLSSVENLGRTGFPNREFDLSPRKDTIAVPGKGYVVIRFRADNPGYWLFRCHILFIMRTGISTILHVGTHADLPPVPNNFPRCGD